MIRRPLPQRRGSETFDLRFWSQNFTITIGRYSDGVIGEVFIDGGKTGQDIQSTARDAAVVSQPRPAARHTHRDDQTRYHAKRCRGGCIDPAGRPSITWRWFPSGTAMRHEARRPHAPGRKQTYQRNRGRTFHGFDLGRQAAQRPIVRLVFAMLQDVVDRRTRAEEANGRLVQALRAWQRRMPRLQRAAECLQGVRLRLAAQRQHRRGVVAGAQQDRHPLSPQWSEDHLFLCRRRQLPASLARGAVFQCESNEAALAGLSQRGVGHFLVHVEIGERKILILPSREIDVSSRPHVVVQTGTQLWDVLLFESPVKAGEVISRANVVIDVIATYPADQQDTMMFELNRALVARFGKAGA